MRPRLAAGMETTRRTGTATPSRDGRRGGRRARPAATGSVAEDDDAARAAAVTGPRAAAGKKMDL